MGCACSCVRGGAWNFPISREEVAEELEDYKASLESEIRILEKRIKGLKDKTE